MKTYRDVPERLKNKAEVVLVVEMTIETKAVKFVLRVGVIQSFQKLQLLQPGLVPDKHTPTRTLSTQAECHDAGIFPSSYQTSTVLHDKANTGFKYIHIFDSKRSKQYLQDEEF